MPQWLIDLLNNPVAVTALGTAFAIPLLNFLAQVLLRKSPPPPPVAHDVRDLPDHPLLVSTKVHLQDEEREMLLDVRKAIEKEVLPCIRQLDRRLDKIEGRADKIDGQVELVNDRLDILMRR